MTEKLRNGPAKVRLAVAAGFSACAILTAGVLLAEAGSPAQQATALIKTLQALNKPKLTARAIDGAEHALEQAKSHSKRGQQRNAQLWEEVGLEWAGLGQDLVRAAEAEQQAQEAEERLARLNTKLKRARALLEETQARRGRAQVELQQVQAEKAGATPAEKQP